MSSPEPSHEVSLRAIAREAIAYALREHVAPELDPELFPAALREPGASFVTLEIAGQLRGCTGSLEPTRPLVCDVARNAYRSAFEDPRFPMLRPEELPALDLHVSLLSALVPLPVTSERELLDALRPGVDGLVLREGARSATFLPAVWRSLPDPEAFLEHLRIKAGLPRGYWSEGLRFERYTVADAS